jgi:hypothetical protein
LVIFGVYLAFANPFLIKRRSDQHFLLKIRVLLSRYSQKFQNLKFQFFVIFGVFLAYFCILRGSYLENGYLNNRKCFKIQIPHSKITQKVKKIKLKFLLLLRLILVFFAFSGTRIWVMDHEIIKTNLKFVFSMVELLKNTKKSNFNFWSFYGQFWSFLHFQGPLRR